MSCSVRPPGAGRVTRTSETSRSVRSLASASSSVATPFIGVSAEAIASSRPGTRGSVGGRNASSTPRVMTWSRSGSTPKSRAMSRLLLSETVRICGSRRATLPCMRRKEYQRRRLAFLRPDACARSTRRSKVIGWWIVVTSGRPSSAILSIP